MQRQWHRLIGMLGDKLANIRHRCIVVPSNVTEQLALPVLDLQMHERRRCSNKPLNLLLITSVGEQVLARVIVIVADILALEAQEETETPRRISRWE
jgi:hypothetical protein